LLIAAAGSAQPADHRTYFTFSGPVELPGVALAPGKYLFRIANPESSGNVVRLASAQMARTSTELFRGCPHCVPTVLAQRSRTGWPIESIGAAAEGEVASRREGLERGATP
jgi:hypothetical protein